MKYISLVLILLSGCKSFPDAPRVRNLEAELKTCQEERMYYYLGMEAVLDIYCSTPFGAITAGCKIRESEK